MTLTQMLEKLGGMLGWKGEAFLTFESITIRVRVIDVRQVFSRLDALVTPVGGTGSKWIDASRLKLITGQSYLETS